MAWTAESLSAGKLNPFALSAKAPELTQEPSLPKLVAFNELIIC
jgi:hypothetical protein